MPPYVGMNGKQDGGYNAMYWRSNADISPGGEFYTPKTRRSALWRSSIFTVAIRLFKIVTKVTNLETVKIEFRHLPFLLSYRPV